MKKIVIVETVIMFFLGIIILTQLVGFSWSQNEILKSCQPEDIDYQSWDPYCLWIKVDQKTLGNRPVVIIAKKADPDGVFHGFPYPYSINEQNVSEIKVAWKESGVELSAERSFTTVGFTMIIPKESFIGGR